jgi:hypothetical protein
MSAGNTNRCLVDNTSARGDKIEIENQRRDTSDRGCIGCVGNHYLQSCVKVEWVNNDAYRAIQ